MKFDIENVTEPDMAWDEYSVMLGMDSYTVTVEDSEEYEAYDSNGKEAQGEMAYHLIQEVIKYRKGENNERTD